MSVFGALWAEFLYRPIFNLLVVFLAIFGGNMGVAIVLLTLLVRLLLLRNSMAGANMSKGMSSIQPKMEEIQEKYKDDPKKLSEETMKLLKKEGAGPMK
jgi:inner membrane protein oxaA